VSKPHAIWLEEEGSSSSTWKVRAPLDRPHAGLQIPPHAPAIRAVLKAESTFKAPFLA
jgi:hypothetical protein